jgi:transcriptional regulator with XRE-family HTH domain
LIHERLYPVRDQQPLERFAAKKYRDGYLQSRVRGFIAYQIQALREKLGLTQAEFAELTGKKQSTISRLEDTEYGKVSVQTLLDIACATNVALVVKFASYPDFLDQTRNMSLEALQPRTIQESLSERQSLSHAGGSAYRYFLDFRTSQGAKTAQDYIANDNANEQRGSAASSVYNQARPFIPQLSDAGAA